MPSTAFAVADAFNAAIKARSAEQLAATYADDAIVWNNVQQQAMSKAESVAVLAGVFRVSRELEYVDVRRHPIDGGVVQTHRLVGIFADGAPMPDLHACIIFQTADGLITRIDEYFDLSGYGPVFERLSALQTA